MDFIEEIIDEYNRPDILDVGCKTCRHILDLARRGYQTTGLDLSQSMLDRARLDADHKNLPITLVRADARDLPFCEEFDVVLVLCQRAFP